MTAARRHRRLEFPRPDQAVPEYLNLYRIGPEEEPGPLLLYVGGAITERQRAERFATEPLPILEQFDLAFATAPLPRLDLLVAPAPTRRADPEDLLDGYEEFFLDACGTVCPPGQTCLAGLCP